MKNDDLKIRTVMHPTPVTINPTQTLATAKKIMIEHNIRHLPVQSGGKVVGVLSDRDIYFLLASDPQNENELKVKDALTDPPYVVGPDAPLHEVARRMASERIGSALIVEKERCIGIFTTVDACHILAQALSGNVEQ